jgi:hypothetical protein
MKTATILLTGATGFLGALVVKSIYLEFTKALFTTKTQRHQERKRTASRFVYGMIDLRSNFTPRWKPTPLGESRRPVRSSACVMRSVISIRPWFPSRVV